MLGIENLKKLLQFSFDFTRELQSALADGKFRLTELIGFFDEVIQIPGVVRSWPEIKAEFADLDATERQDLYTYFQNGFDIPNDKIESFVENALMNAVSLIMLVEQWKNLKNPPITPTV